MKEYYIDSDGIQLHAKLDRAEGVEKGPLCILIHGFTGHMEEEHIIEVQKAMNDSGVSVLRVEMYGHGGSGGTFAEHTLYKWVSNVFSVLEHVKTLDFVTDLYLCGHSQGGLLAMMMGGMCPDVFKALIPLSPAWMIPEVCRQGSILGADFDPEHIPEMVETEEWSLSGNYIRVAQSIFVEPAIERFGGPVFIVHGDADETVPYSYAVKAAEKYKNCKLVSIHGADHCFNGHLDELYTVIRSWKV